MPPPTPAETPSKAKTALIFLAIAMATILLLHTFYTRLMRSSTTSLLITANIIILSLLFHYWRNPDRTPHAPLFSFPSLSPQPRYESLSENNVDSPEPVLSLPQDPKTDVLYHDSMTTNAVAWETGESLERNSTTHQEQKTSNLEDDRADDNQGSDETLDETWKSILARGKAKPVRSNPGKTVFERSNHREDDSKLEMKKRSKEERREKEKATEGSNYYSVERKAEGWRQRDAIAISSDELSHLSETFIKKQYNDLRIERQESDQRRLAERLRFSNYRNAVRAS